jgi:hypothetical protein
MVLTPEERRDAIDARIKAAVDRLTRTRRGEGPDLRISNIVYMLAVKRAGHTQADYEAQCEYGPGRMPRFPRTSQAHDVVPSDEQPLCGGVHDAERDGDPLRTDLASSAVVVD